MRLISPIVVAVLTALLCLVGCGQKGPLKLPERGATAPAAKPVQPTPTASTTPTESPRK